MSIFNELHEALPIRASDFPERNRCDICHRIPGVVFPGCLELGQIVCLTCIAKTENDPTEFVMVNLQNMGPVVADMAVKYKDEYFEDKK